VIPHDVPSAQQLVESVREWLERDVLAGTTGRLQFHTRVAINVLAMVERELELGPEQAERHRERLTDLGFANDEELVAAIRNASGAPQTPDEISREAAIRAAVWASVRDKLAVANPKYLDADPE
jgi:hypothetical protein